MCLYHLNLKAFAKILTTAIIPRCYGSHIVASAWVLMTLQEPTADFLSESCSRLTPETPPKSKHQSMSYKILASIIQAVEFNLGKQKGI